MSIQPPHSSSYAEFLGFLSLFKENPKATLEQSNLFLESLRFNFPFVQLPDFESIPKIFSSINETRPFAFKTKWLNEEIMLLVWTVFHLIVSKQYKSPENLILEDWEKIARLFQDRTAKQCMFKFLNLLRSNPIKRENRWTAQEDGILFEIARKYQEKNLKFKWTRIAIDLFEKTQRKKIRMGKHCRERWNNHLNPGLNKGKWTSEEDLLLLRYVVQKGRKWARISRLLQGRNEYSVKNRFYFLLKKQGITVNSRAFTSELKTLIKSMQKRISSPEKAISRENSLEQKEIEQEENIKENEEKIEKNQEKLKEKQVFSLIKQENKEFDEIIANSHPNEISNVLNLENTNNFNNLSMNSQIIENPIIKQEDMISQENERKKVEMTTMLNNYWNSLNATTRMNDFFGMSGFQMNMFFLRQQQMQMVYLKSFYETMNSMNQNK